MLKGKVALVTGAARGIGRAICETSPIAARISLSSTPQTTAAAEECKASVEARGVKCRAYKCDVSDYHAVEEAFKSVVTEFGTVDILVNNAGITRDRLVLAMKEQDFDDVIAVNLKGAFNLIKQVYPVLARKRSGRIINISSVAGALRQSRTAQLLRLKGRAHRNDEDRRKGACRTRRDLQRDSPRICRNGHDQGHRAERTSRRCDTDEAVCKAGGDRRTRVVSRLRQSRVYHRRGDPLRRRTRNVTSAGKPKDGRKNIFRFAAARRF